MAGGCREAAEESREGTEGRGSHKRRKGEEVFTTESEGCDDESDDDGDWVWLGYVADAPSDFEWSDPTDDLPNLTLCTWHDPGQEGEGAHSTPLGPARHVASESIGQREGSEPSQDEWACHPVSVGSPDLKGKPAASEMAHSRPAHSDPLARSRRAREETTESRGLAPKRQRAFASG